MSSDLSQEDQTIITFGIFFQKIIQLNPAYGQFSLSHSMHFLLKLTRLIRTLRDTDTFFGPNGVRNTGL